MGAAGREPAEGRTQLSERQRRTTLRARALWTGYTVLVFCGLLLAPLDAVVDDLPSTWAAASIAGLVVSLPVSLVWVLGASYDPVEVIPSASIIIGFHVLGSAVFTLVQVALVRTCWKLIRRYRSSRAKPSGVGDGSAG